MTWEKRGVHRQTLGDILPLVAAVALLLLGIWMRWSIVLYDGPPTQDDFNRYANETFSYSDIASLYFRDGLAGQPRPYLDYPLEYPVGIGLLIYILNLVAPSLEGYFLLTSLVMGACGIAIAGLMDRFPHGRLLLFALSPSLALYINLNWDMWGVLLMVASLLLFARERDGPAAAVLAAAVWTKFFPVVFLPFVVLDRLQHQGWRAAAKVGSIFALVSAAINAPLLLIEPEGFWHFFRFNASREGDLNFMTLFLGFAPQDVRDLNAISGILLVAGLFVLCSLQSRAPRGAWLTAGAGALAWFFFVGKVYSPQYGLWIVALLAIVGASTALAVAWSAMDLAYFAASFVTLGLGGYGEAQGWFVEHALLPAAVLREGMLLVVVGWCAGRMRAPPARDPAQHRDERLRGNPPAP